MLEIANILPGSIADERGLKAGDVIEAVNGSPVCDVIDYRFLISDEHVLVRYHRNAGGTGTITIDKDPDEGLGLEFSPFRITRCRNRCIFCFVDQMPSQCRKSLYIKDDDYRASFLYGNYITLGALSEADWERILRQRLSPLYISVHTTDHKLRTFMLGNKNAQDIIKNMKRLAAGGIRMHTQIVLCPGVNDGAHLERTIEDIARLVPAVLSIAVVPVGLTSHRKGLFPLRQFTRHEARSVIDDMQTVQRRFKRQFGTRLVFASDEFYVKAGQAVPPASFYEDFPQRENGVGMVAEFLREVRRTRLPKRVKPIRATLITGVSFKNILHDALTTLRDVQGVHIRQVTVKNEFFGHSVTVAGLLAGQDILRTLKGKRLGDVVIIPANALKEDEDLFIDGMSLSEMSHKLSIQLVKAEGFQDVVKIVRGSGSHAS